MFLRIIISGYNRATQDDLLPKGIKITEVFQDKMIVYAGKLFVEFR